MKTKTKRKNKPAWQAVTQEISRYLFFVLYVLALAALLFASELLREPGRSVSPEAGDLKR